MITLRKNGYRVVFEGTDTKFVRRDYAPNGKLVITAIYYDCSLDESIKNYINAGWTTNHKKYIYVSESEIEKVCQEVETLQ